MKIVLIGDYPPPYGGISVHVQQLSRLLTQSGAECRVIDIEPGTSPKEGAIRVKGPLDFLQRLLWFSYKGFVAHIHTNGHNFKSWLAIWITTWAGFLFGRRNIATIHSGLMPAYAEGAGLLGRIVIRTALWPSGKVIAVNEEIESALLKLKINPDRLVVLPAFALGVRSGFLPERVVAWREQFQPLITSAVYLEKEYGTELLIEACHRLAQKYPNLGCLIMGSGSCEGEIRKQIQKLNMEDRIFLLGNVPHEICLSIMEKSDLFVRPTFFDGDAISVREGLALGIPTVASNVGYRPKGVFLFEPGDVPALARQMENGLREKGSSRRTEGREQNLVLIHGIYEQVCRGVL
jgi:glycosyltransferase involved in cell wall biosynthesis